MYNLFKSILFLVFICFLYMKIYKKSHINNFIFYFTFIVAFVFRITSDSLINVAISLFVFILMAISYYYLEKISREDDTCENEE